MKKKLLLAGGGYADIPLIKAAQKMGYYVISSGNRADDLGHIVSDEYKAADFSNPEQMLNIAKELDIDAICACANDFSAISSSYVAEKLNLPGHDSYETCKLLHHKDSYRQFALSNKIPTPKAIAFSNLELALESVKNFPIPFMIKPTDLTGGKGISKIIDLRDSKRAIELAFSISKSKRIVIEEFIEGSRHGFSAFIKNKKVVFFFSDNEHYYKNPYMVSAASTPSFVHVDVEQKLIAQAEKIASLLSLKDGLFHIQYILQNEEPVIIEICRRAPGDLYIQFVELATNINFPLHIVKAAIGDEVNLNLEMKPKGFFTRHCVMPDRKGIVDKVTFDISIKDNIIKKVMWWKKGDVIRDPLMSKCGIVFLQFDSLDEMLKTTENLPELIKVNIS